MNLGDKKLKKDVPGAWMRVHAAVGAAAPRRVHTGGAPASARSACGRPAGPSRSTTFPPLLYSFSPQRAAAATPLATPLNPAMAQLHYDTCRWGGCHPPRGDAAPNAPGWAQSAPCDTADNGALKASTCAVAA